MLTKRSTPDGRGRVEHGQGAPDVGLDRLAGCISSSGRCLSAAAWNTTCGRRSSNTSATRWRVADVGEHEVVASRAAPGRRCESCTACRADSSRSSMISSAGLEPRDLAAQLGADRAAGAGDEHPLAGEVAGDRVEVGVDLVAPEQVGDVDVADVGDRGAAGLEQLAGAREHLDVEPTRGRSAADLADRLRAGARDGDDRRGGAGLVADARQGHGSCPSWRRRGSGGAACSGRRRRDQPGATECWRSCTSSGSAAGHLRRHRSRSLVRCLDWPPRRRRGPA